MTSIWFPWAVFITAIVSARAIEQPNIVFVMADDLGWDDVSFHGSDQIQTPNIDVMASKGVVLQQYYSEAICTPARTALLTGKYPMRLGMQGYPLRNAEDRAIPLTEQLLPQYLKELGYATHLVGKWHVGMSKNEHLPTNRGYDTHYGSRGGFIDYYTYNKVESWPDGREMFGLDLFDGFVPQNTERRYIVDLLTERAINVIENHNKTTPLFLHLTHNAPHAGNNGGALQPPLNANSSNMHVASSDRRLYADVVNSLDKSFGEVVKALADNDMLNKTIIIFASDNGAPTIGDYRNWGINLPFRGQKDTPWEGGVRVPAFIWHSSLKSRVWNGLMHITDWLPTLAAAAGGQIDTEIDGVNQWDALVNNTKSNRREVLISIDESSKHAFAAYRAGDYKIVIGNVSDVNSDYYGANYTANKGQLPNYHEEISKSDANAALRSIGIKLKLAQVDAVRQKTKPKQLDETEDTVPCIPSSTQGCLYNLKKDPSEKHNLWETAENIASKLKSRLMTLWSQQLKRGPAPLREEADPLNFNYTWVPWIN